MTLDDRRFGMRTRAIHAGAPPDPATGSRALPIHLTSSFVFDSTEHAAELFALRTYGNIYSRIPIRPSPRSKNGSLRSKAASAALRPRAD